MSSLLVDDALVFQCRPHTVFCLLFLSSIDEDEDVAEEDVAEEDVAEEDVADEEEEGA